VIREDLFFTVKKGMPEPGIMVIGTGDDGRSRKRQGSVKTLPVDQKKERMHVFLKNNQKRIVRVAPEKLFSGCTGPKSRRPGHSRVNTAGSRSIALVSVVPR